MVQALTEQALRLGASTGAEQLQALKYVVHLVGDVHQPWHAGFADDRGGNTYQLRAFGRGTNAHRLWDTDLPQDLAPDAASLARLLGATPTPPLSLDFAPGDWAGESCRIVSRPDVYPSRQLDSAYAGMFEPVMKQRLLLAGLRLATLLNRTFGGSS